LNDPHRELVERGYDRVAEQYLATKDPRDPLALSALEGMARDLPPGAAVLDLGCGAGVPATLWLAERSYSVTGVDLSEKQLGLARKLVPGATFVKADMTELDLGSEAFDAVVAFHSIIHVPKEEHPALLGEVHRWLRPGGLFLATLTLTDFEGEDGDWEGWGPRCAGATTTPRRTWRCCATPVSRSYTPSRAPAAARGKQRRPGSGSSPAGPTSGLARYRTQITKKGATRER